eukprot:13871545-Alexandrium_andersonii.AAC.1
MLSCSVALLLLAPAGAGPRNVRGSLCCAWPSGRGSDALCALGLCALLASAAAAAALLRSARP